MVLLHGPAGNAAHWVRVLADLVTTHRVIAPDLPGHGATVVDGELDADRVLAWLGELIEQTCASPPMLVGYALGGAIAARFRRARRPGRGWCSSTRSGLAPFEPDPAFGAALHAFLARAGRGDARGPVAPVRARPRRPARPDGRPLGQPFEAYNLDRARTPSAWPRSAA